MKKDFQISISTFILLILAFEVKSQHPYLPQTDLPNISPTEYQHSPIMPVSNHLDGLVFLLDSTYSFSWDEQLNDWGKQTKIAYQYDASGNQIDYIYSLWLSSWQNNARTTWSFDLNGQIAEVIDFLWNPDTGEWMNYSKIHLTYNSGPYPSESIDYQWDESTQSWEEQDRSVYQLDAQGRQINRIYYTWQSVTSTWLEQDRNTYQWDAQNRPSENVYYTWNIGTGIWEPEHRVSTTYTNYVEATSFIWNETYHTWQPYNIHTTEVYNDGSETINAFYSFDTTAIFWNLISRERTVHDTVSPVLATDTRYKWDIEGLFWVPFEKHNYQYDFNGNVDVLIISKWDGIDWKFFYKEKYYWSQHDLVLGLDESIATDMIIYPNPAKNAIFISGMEGPINVKIISENGSLVQSGKLNDGSEVINIQNLPVGKYFIQLIAGGKISIKPFVKP